MLWASIDLVPELQRSGVIPVLFRKSLTISFIPKIAFMGVLISRDMLARNLVFASEMSISSIIKRKYACEMKPRPDDHIQCGKKHQHRHCNLVTTVLNRIHIYYRSDWHYQTDHIIQNVIHMIDSEYKGEKK